jgi:N4-gp56 family major capsid protein
MGLGVNNNTNINSELFAPLVAAAQYAAYENSVARKIVSVFDMPDNAGKVVQVPLWDAITASNPDEGNIATFADTNTTSASITLKEFVVAHRITDMLRDSAYNDVMAQVGDQAGRAIAEAIDTDVFGNFSDFTELTAGTANLVINTSTILKGVAQLRSAKLTGPFVAVLHPKQAYNIKANLVYSGQNTPALSNVGESVNDLGFLGTIYGVQVYESSLLTVNASGDAVGAIFAPQAIAHSMRGSIRLETQRQAAYRATDLVLTAVAGSKTLRSTFGFKITSDASLGTL